MAAVLEAFDTDLARHWTLAALSNEVYVGSFHLAHEFKRWMGVSPMAYLSQLRAKRAAILLGRDRRLDRVDRPSRRVARARGILPAVL